ncbi:BRCT domain-containing protein At4g02110 [Pyrus communis]|uniref:BRCT domain-containing protein At4g02110 n=1 Tax=Pyrus communis TaxID=23211 RepID=UPI0035BF9EC2
MTEGSSPAKTFVGVRFLLLGFDPFDEHQVRSKLVDCGGEDVAHYSPNCTHVIVDKIVYDDPVCVAARNDAKTLVTALWVHHSFDVGLPIDPTSIIYRPLRDLNGIPGAKRLIVCLTGYQRQDRDDIMTMVGLMGARFSKPLVANKVTHLVCYKFEGEKYELAKKIPKMKLVNHRWLEDCLRDWQLLPEDNYNISGYELEMMEAEARDSEDEAENTFGKQSGVRSMYKSPHNIKSGSPATSRFPISGEVPKVPLIFDNAIGNLSIPRNENKLDQTSSFSNSYVSKGLSCQDACELRDASGCDLNDQHHLTPDPKVRDDFISNCGSAGRASHSAGKLSYSRQTLWMPTVPLYTGDKSSGGSVSSKVPICKSSATLKDQANDKFDPNCVEVPLKGIHLQNGEESSGILPRKRVMDLSYASSKSQKTSPGAKSGSMHSPSPSNKSPKVKPTSLIDGSCSTSHYIVTNDDHSLDKTGNLNAAGNSMAGVSPAKLSNLIQKPLACDLPFSATVISNMGKDENANMKSPRTTLRRSRKSSLSNKRGIVDGAEEKPTAAVSKAVELQDQPQDVEGSSASNKKSMNNSSNDPADLNMLKEGNNDLVTKHLKQKVKSKKTLGSRPRLVSANQKGSVHLYKDASLNDTAVLYNAGDHQKSPNPTKLDVPCPDVNVEAPNEVEGKDVDMSADVAEKNIESVDDETQAPEEESEHKLENVVHEAKGIVVQATSKCVEKSEQEQHLQDHSDACTPRDAMASLGTEGNEREKSVSDNISLLVEPAADGDAVEGKKNQGKKHALGKTKLKTVHPVTDVMKPKKVASEENTRNDNTRVTEKKKEKRLAGLVGKSKCHGAPQNKLENSAKMKENKPIVGGDQTVSKAEQQAEKSTAKSGITPLKIIQTSAERSDNPSIPEGKASSKVKIEPVRFILSGHRFQRKEFQKVIKRLKGRCCRDSHHWSYQATHFISPDRVGRTEKFFAAAASGRWILKSDYLEASDKEGRFLEEEPYEWYKNGLSEDGTINLEAPRKWRLLRERTGHGAFHGMRVIIYGECIAPPLDTLKRVMKAGDGTIFATSPPYTRFLKSGIDYAIVSPGMPRADMWVQELLKHEIPCVVADYLVEYVCKPGYPLDRHVLYNTNAWAEKSFERVQSRAEEVVEEAFTGGDGDDASCGGGSDIPCVVCGSGERGEVMLICGNESGSVGCGIGTHIECCNPPLESVPKDDWFCPNCSWSKNSTKSSKKRKKGRSSK